MSIFEKIISKDIPADIVYEDELCIAFNDINPQAPIHVLIVPKKHIKRLSKSTEEDKSILGHLLFSANMVAKILKIDSKDKGYRVVINNGKNGGETVPHMHLHLIGGKSLKWPPG